MLPPGDACGRGEVEVEQAQRSRVVLIGGDAQRLRGLRVFLDQLAVFEPVAIATGGAGLNALTRLPWDCAVVVDDLHDMLPEQVILAARERQARVPFVGIVLGSNRARVSALYAAGAVEVVYISATPTSELVRAIVRAIERQQLLDRIDVLETELARRKIIDEETSLYPSWRFDEDWRLEQLRARRRGGDLSVLSVRLDTAPELYLLSPRDKLTALRQAGRAIKSSLREGDVACHDGSGAFRIMLVDGGAGTAAEVSGHITHAVRHAFAQSSITVAALVSMEESFERIRI
jgi:PleD family two-component response regulator